MWAVGSKLRSGGFTLLEIMLVLVIASFMVGIAGPRLVGLLPGVELKTASQRLVSFLKQSRSRAIAENGTVVVVFDHKTSRVLAEGSTQSVSIPEEAELKIDTASSISVQGHPDSIFFYPNGASNGANLTLSSDAGEYLIRIDWLTGKVHVDE